MKYPQEKNMDLQNTHEEKFGPKKNTMARQHDTHERHDGTGPAEFTTLFESWK